MISSGWACTAKIVDPDTPPDIAAVIVVVPADAPVARPLALMVATAVFEELQVTWLVIFCVLPSE